MQISLNIPVKEHDEVYTIHNKKIGRFFVEKIKFIDIPKVDNITNSIILGLNRYNDGVNFFQIESKLSDCFLTKEDLINNL